MITPRVPRCSTETASLQGPAFSSRRRKTAKRMRSLSTERSPQNAISFTTIPNTAQSRAVGRIFPVWQREKNTAAGGSAKKIVRFILDLAKEKGYREIALGVNCDNFAALHLYRKLGFSVYETAKDDYGEYYKMERTL